MTIFLPLFSYYVYVSVFIYLQIMILIIITTIYMALYHGYTIQERLARRRQGDTPVQRNTSMSLLGVSQCGGEWRTVPISSSSGRETVIAVRGGSSS